LPIETSSVFDAEPVEAADHADLLAVPYGRDLAPDVELPLPVRGLLAQYDAKGDAGEIVEVPVARGDAVTRILLYGTGDGSAAALRKAAAGVARRARGRHALTIRLPENAGESGWSALAEGALLGSYTFTIGSGRAKPVRRIRFTGQEQAREPVRRGEVTARATALTRDLANTPSSIKTPEWLAGRALEIAKESGLSVKVWDESQLRAEGFGGILAVGQGSVNPPRLIQLSYEPDEPQGGAHGTREGGKHWVLVGKGITFDSGGLSLKPTENMKLQKTDMAGGGAVIAVMAALRELGAGVRVTGLVAAAENMPSGTAQRPSDVITHYGGRTVEVLNTDAEGRLVLADVLAYADTVLDADVVVDIATLTGAIGVALGRDIGAVFSTSDELAEGLIKAGEASGDRLWRMPIIEEYAPAIESSVADLANVETGSTYGAGAITAALFLRAFTGGRPWAHLDIAGVGRSMTDEGVLTKGATGFGVRLLLEYLTRGV
jgi:leucyl aminopeptidase